MDIFNIKILNWDTHQPKSEKLRHPHWFKVKNTIASSQSLFMLNAAQKWVWICLLAECSKKKSGEITINLDYAVKLFDVPKKTILETIEIMSQNQTLTANCQSTDSPLTLEENRIEEKRIEKKNKSLVQFDFEKVYAEYPRKEGKTKGIEVCDRVIKTQEGFDALLGAVRRYSAHCRRENTDKKYIKLFSSFMTVWTDWIDPDAGKVKFVSPPTPTATIQNGHDESAYTKTPEEIAALKAKLLNPILKTVPEEKEDLF